MLVPILPQPLSMLVKMNPLVTSLSLYDIANTPGVAADLSHLNTPAVVRPRSPSLRALHSSANQALRPPGGPLSQPAERGPTSMLDTAVSYDIVQQKATSAMASSSDACLHLTPPARRRRRTGEGVRGGRPVEGCPHRLRPGDHPGGCAAQARYDSWLLLTRRIRSLPSCCLFGGTLSAAARAPP